MVAKGWRWGKGSVGTTGGSISTASESGGVIRRGEWGFARTILSMEGKRGVFQGGGTTEVRERNRGGTVEIRFEGSKGDQGRKRAVLVRTTAVGQESKRQ